MGPASPNISAQRCSNLSFPASRGGPASALPSSTSNVREYQSAGSHSPQALQDALLRHQGSQTRAAQSLGLTLRQFSYRLRKAGLR